MPLENLGHLEENRGQQSETLVAETVFGPLSYRHDTTLSFPQGLLGLPHLQEFILGAPASEKLKSFFVFQPLPVDLHSFLVWPLPLEGPIAPEDFKNVCTIYGLNVQTTHMLSMVIFQKDDDCLKVFTNLAAPLFIDFEARKGIQHVFERANYPSRHEIMTGVYRA